MHTNLTLKTNSPGHNPWVLSKIYPNARVVIDCTEIFTEMPASNRSQWATFSKYKHHNTTAALIGIALRGAVSFVSDLNAGKNSNRQMANHCGILSRGAVSFLSNLNAGKNSNKQITSHCGILSVISLSYWNLVTI